MRFVFSTIFLIFISLNIFCVIATAEIPTNIQAELQITPTSSLLKEGDLVEGVLKVWPIENVDLTEFKHLDKMVITDNLTVVEVESLGVSANNADVVEAKMLFFVKHSGQHEMFTYKGYAIPVQVIPALNVQVSANEHSKNLNESLKDYYIMDQGVIHTSLVKTMLFLILTIGMLFLVWKRKQVKSFIQSFTADPTKVAAKKYNEIFLKANTRLDYEEIYTLRSDWLKLIKDQAPAYREFFKTMEQHQYKKTWGIEELDEVKNSFDVISGSFK